jgi:phosphonopyruvate decarboxylase
VIAMIAPDDFIHAVKDAGLDLYAGVPDSLLKELCACLRDTVPADRNIITANEGNAIALAAGYHIATGKAGVVYMQNSGQGNAVNPLASLTDPAVYAIPMLLLIGWRGQPGVTDEPQHVKQGEITLDLLHVLGVPYRVLSADWHTDLAEMLRIMRAQNTPVALVIPKGSFQRYTPPINDVENTAGKHVPASTADRDLPLLREQALSLVLDAVDPGDFLVTTTGKTSRELFELREARGDGHTQDFLTVGSMGHTASIAFGMALESNRRVWCIDGDGSFLMHLGGLAVIAQNMPDNFRYVLNNNGAHESVGGQPTVARDIDIAGILQAMGFLRVFTACNADELTCVLHQMADLPGSALIIETRPGSRDDLGRPTTTPQENKVAMMRAFAGDEGTESAG